MQLAGRRRELVLFNLAIDSKLRACDLVKLRVRDACHGQTVTSRTIVLQQKTQKPVQFEITEPTREGVAAWIGQAGLLRRTKATLVYRRTKNLRAVQILLGHAQLESTVRNLGVEVNDALEMAEQTEV